MFSFFFHNLSSSWTRTMSIVLTTFISGCIGLFFYFLYINIHSGIAFYTLDGIDEKRFSITAGTNVFQLFDREKGWIPKSVLDNLQTDTTLERYREFRFIDLSVLGKFDLFKFSLDIDIPTFSIRESSGWWDGIGISSRMLKYYNLEFAGSHAFFPVFAESDIIGRGVTLVFNASRLFNLPEKRENTYTSRITHVDSDYPWFGVVIPYEVAEKELQKLWYSQNAPYKIIGYLRDISSRTVVESRYNWYNLKFDADIITEQKQTLRTVAEMLVSVMVGILAILYWFLFLLFGGYFREKEYVFSLIRQYKIESFSRYILVFLEPVLLIFSWFFVGILMWILWQSYGIWLLQVFLQSKNIFFPILTVSSSYIILILWLNALMLFLLLIFSYSIKRKQW